MSLNSCNEILTFKADKYDIEIKLENKEMNLLTNQQIGVKLFLLINQQNNLTLNRKEKI